jgi:hypothetical protein
MNASHRSAHPGDVFRRIAHLAAEPGAVIVRVGLTLVLVTAATVVPRHHDATPIPSSLRSTATVRAMESDTRDVSLPVPDADWLADIDRGLAAREYEATRNGAGLQAPNRAHDLRTYFDPLGVRVVDRTDPGEPTLVTLQLRAIGRGAAAPHRVAAGQVEAMGSRVEIRRAGLTEWYVNSPDGLEQGFTLEHSPQGSGPLVFEVAVEGAHACASGEAIAFGCRHGRHLSYGAAFAHDAHGVPIPVTLEPGDDCVRIVVADAGATYPVTIDPLLTSSADTQLGASQAAAGFGRHVAGAGDVNGDGFDDVIVGAEMYDAGETDEGAAFVFLGGPSGIANNAAPSATLQSNQTQAFLGRVAGAGDVNGDGYADVIVGAHAYDSGETEEGAAFVFLGSSTGIANGTPATAAATLQGNQIGATFGISEASAGDINGDGYSDVIVGAENYNGGGGAFIFLGGAAGIASGGPATAATSLISSQASASFGFSVAGAGDVNGDGFSDVIVGANRWDAPETSEGGAFIYLGGPAGIASGSQASATTTLQSNQIGALFGFSVAGAGDVNGDGFSDVIVGAYLYDSGETNEGAAFVFLGQASGVPNASVLGASATLQSNQASARFGERVAGAGDVNGDGYADVVVGASGYDSGQTDEGGAFVFIGGPSGIVSADVLTAFVRLQSNQVSAAFGVEAAGAGDIDGDGHADVIVGAPAYDAGHTDEGVAFIYRGGAQGVIGRPGNDRGDDAAGQPGRGPSSGTALRRPATSTATDTATSSWAPVSTMPARQTKARPSCSWAARAALRAGAPRVRQRCCSPTR